MQTWKGTAERIFYANTASTSSSIHQIAGEHRKQQQHQNTTKLLPPPPKRRREPRVGTSGSREPNKSISTGPEERFQRIKKLLEKVLHEAEQLPAVTTNRAEHQCNEKEERLDEKNKNSVVQQTIALMDSLEQLRQFQDIVCTRYLTDNATLQTLEQADPAASSRLADANRTNEIVATTEPRERRKKERRRRRREEEKNKIKGHRH